MIHLIIDSLMKLKFLQDYDDRFHLSVLTFQYANKVNQKLEPNP